MLVGRWQGNGGIMAERMTRGVDTSSLPKLQELMAAYQNNGPAEALTSLSQGVTSGIDIASKIAQRRAEMQKVAAEIQREKQKAQEEQSKIQAREDITRLVNPITPQSSASSVVPARLSEVANVNPDQTQVPGPMQPYHNVLRTGEQIASEAESERIPRLKAAFVNAAPEQTSGKILDSVLGTAGGKNTQIAVNSTTGQFRVVSPDAEGRYNLEPGETLEKVAMAEKRAAPQFERNEIMRKSLQQREDFKNMDLIAKYGNLVNPGSLKGSDQIAAKAYDNTGRALTLIKQVEDQGNVTPQQLAELTSAVLRSVTGQTVVPQGLFNEYLPDTLKQKYSDFNTFIRSQPTFVEMDEFVTNMKDTIERERELNRSILEPALARQSAGVAQLLQQRNPKEFQKLTEALSTDQPNVANEIISSRSTAKDKKATLGSAENDLKSALKAVLTKKPKKG